MLETTALIIAKPELREPFSQRRDIENLMSNAVLMRHVDAGLDKIRRAVCMATSGSGTEKQPADFAEQRTPSRTFQFAPDFMGALRELHILRTFPQSDSGDARVAVRRTAIVRRLESIDANRFCATTRQLIKGCTPRGTEADNDYIQWRSQGAFPILKRCFSVRMNIRPRATAGVEWQSSFRT